MLHEIISLLFGDFILNWCNDLKTINWFNCNAENFQKTCNIVIIHSLQLGFDDLSVLHTFWTATHYTVQQIENDGNKHWAHYAGLVGSDERWKTVYSVWLYQVKFSGYLNFKNFDFGRLPSLNRMRYFWNMFQKFINLITFPKQAHSSRYSNGNLQK